MLVLWDEDRWSDSIPELRVYQLGFKLFEFLEELILKDEYREETAGYLIEINCAADRLRKGLRNGLSVGHLVSDIIHSILDLFDFPLEEIKKGAN